MVARVGPVRASPHAGGALVSAIYRRSTRYVQCRGSRAHPHVRDGQPPFWVGSAAMAPISACRPSPCRSTRRGGGTRHNPRVPPCRACLWWDMRELGTTPPQTCRRANPRRDVGTATAEAAGER